MEKIEQDTEKDLLVSISWKNAEFVIIEEEAVLLLNSCFKEILTGTITIKLLKESHWLEFRPLV